jgi:oligoendopeptidase F
MELSPTNVPVSVYDNLITTVRANLPSLHRYMALRKRHMGLDELHLYDLNVPLIGGFDDNADLEEGKQAIVQALKVLGPDYSSDVEELFASRRIDYMPHENKQDGGFCFNRRGLKSYILLNFAGKFRDISNLAHEIGHDEHFKLAVSQEACYSRGSPYQFFCAEVASLVNEQLLAQQQVSRASDSKMRLYFLNRQLEDFRGIIIRTTMFAEFERRAYSIAEEGNQPLTLDVLNNLYVQLNKDYFGESVIVDKLVGHEWSRMHHLYYPFYLYTYATGLASAIAIADRILTEGQPAVDAYLGFLSDGNSKYALDSLRDIGVDLSTPAPIERAFKYFESVLDIFERELLAIEK